MNESVAEFQNLVTAMAGSDGISSGQMFGKACLKVNGKACVAQQGSFVIFKLAEQHHAKAMALAGAVLWDPSGKGRPMKEWVALGTEHKKKFKSFATAAVSYVRGS